jgi:hypothetical protein
MASKEAAFAHPSTLDRMGALAKWIAAKAEEMSQLDKRIDRRLEHLHRTEDNLRAMFEAIREQVTSAHSVSSELRNSTFAADNRHQQADEALSNALKKASTLAELLDAKRLELEQTARSIEKETSDRLSQLLEQAQQAQKAQQAQQFQPPIVTEAAATPEPSAEESQTVECQTEESQVTTIQYAFGVQSSAVVESIRRSAIEQIDRLASQAAVAVEPIISRIEDQRLRVEAQLRASVESSEDAMRRRADELGRAADTLVDNLEHRLARRLESVRPRTTEILDSAERFMNQRLEVILDNARLNISAAETELTDRTIQLRPRIDQTLQAVRDDVVEQLARLEEKAFSMTGWLETRMSDRVDALITRTRSALSECPVEKPAPLSPEAVSLICYADEYSAPAIPNSVSVQVFVDKLTERPRRNASVKIFQ